MIHIQAFAIVQEFSYNFFSKINTEMTLRGLRTSNIVERDAAAILVSFFSGIFSRLSHRIHSVLDIANVSCIDSVCCLKRIHVYNGSMFRFQA